MAVVSKDGSAKRKKAKPTKQASTATGPEETNGDTGARDEETPPPKNKKKANQPEDKGDDEAVDAASAGATGDSEDQRRKAQREIQTLVRQLRKEGKSEREINAAKQELKEKLGQSESKRAQKGKAWREKWFQSKEAVKQKKKNKQREHDLVVIPVVWRGRHDKEDIVRAAEEVKECIAQHGVDVWIDSRRHYTPGQKFAHWEHRGVMLRVEIGPEDLQAGFCRVCRAKTPGDYKSVERRRTRLPPAGTRRLLLLLKSWGLTKIPVKGELGPDDEEEEQLEEERRAAAKPNAEQEAAAASTGGDDDIAGNWAPRDREGSAKAKLTTGGKGKKRKRN